MIYFDYGATTPIDDEVLNSYIKTQKQFLQTLLPCTN